VSVACHIHPWERAFILVRAVPYMARTDAGGRFEIKNLPAGDHTFQLWHERTGYLRDVRGAGFSIDARGRMTVTIRPNETTRIEASASGSQFKVEARP
jgi:hypothetical protein